VFRVESQWKRPLRTWHKLSPPFENEGGLPVPRGSAGAHSSFSVQAPMSLVPFSSLSGATGKEEEEMSLSCPRFLGNPFRSPSAPIHCDSLCEMGEPRYMVYFLLLTYANPLEIPQI